MYSLVIPVYKNEESILELLELLSKMSAELSDELEVVFVVDGSPDNSFSILSKELPKMRYLSTLLVLSRNFGSFAAIKEGVKVAKGEYVAVMAADLQEPPELILKFFQILSHDKADVVMGARKGRDDPFLSRLAAKIFWGFYRRFVQKDIPAGGVDVFGCNRRFLSQLLKLEESNSSLISLLFWLGYRRKLVSYERKPRKHGKSAWSFHKKIFYLMDSIFSFTSLPIRVLAWAGIFGLIVSFVFALFLSVAHISHWIDVPGYTTTALLILFFTAFNAFGLGVIGSYVWRTYENTKQRPSAVVMLEKKYSGEN